MLLMGVCNPPGESTTYNGLYFKQSELHDMVQQRCLNGIPVKAEHCGADVGKVCSTFLDTDGALRCIIDVPENSFQGTLVANLVRDGVAMDLSMGYSVDVQHSRDAASRRRLTAGAKKTMEISLVRKGARKGCHIVGFEDRGGKVVWKHNQLPQRAPQAQRQRTFARDFASFFKN